MKKGEGYECIIKHLVHNVYVSCKYTYYIHSYLLQNKMTTVVTVHMCKV
jgi:hypothetical protein